MGAAQVVQLEDELVVNAVLVEELGGAQFALVGVLGYLLGQGLPAEVCGTRRPLYAKPLLLILDVSPNNIVLEHDADDGEYPQNVFVYLIVARVGLGLQKEVGRASRSSCGIALFSGRRRSWRRFPRGF